MNKKRLTGSIAAKIAAICLVIISAVTCVASAAAVIMADYMNVYSSEDRTVVLERWNERLLDQYSVFALVHYMNENGEELRKLNQTNFRYGIIRTADIGAVDLNDPESTFLSPNTVTISALTPVAVLKMKILKCSSCRSARRWR